AVTPRRENNIRPLVEAALSRSPKLTVFPLSSLTDFTSRGAITARVSGGKRATKGERFVQSGSSLTLLTTLSRETMAKPAMSVFRTLPRPLGEVEPTIARPAEPFAPTTAAKSRAILLARASPGSARIVNSFAAWAAVGGSGASASAGLASAALAPRRAYLPRPPRHAPCHKIRLPFLKTGWV